jgi:hypothetical protein
VLPKFCRTRTLPFLSFAPQTL